MLPADAGMSPDNSFALAHVMSAPRRRGDEPSRYTRVFLSLGCSPQTRG